MDICDAVQTITMTFLAHSALGMGVLMGLVRWINPLTQKTTLWAWGAIGLVLGGLPDTLDWVLAQFHVIGRWSLYGWFHHDYPLWLAFVFPTSLHILTDTWIHLFPGYNWWPEYWYLEVGMWLLAGVLIALALRKEKP